MKRIDLKIWLFTIVCCLVAFPLSGQGTGGDFQLANRLMEQEKFSEALPIMRELHESNPGAYVFFDRYIECLIALNEYDEAESAARNQINNVRLRIQPVVRLAEILHIKGEKDEAFATWNRALQRDSENLQSYYTVASSMNKRREYDAAIEIYREAQNKMGNTTLFLNELANNYMQAGRFEEAVKEFFRLVIENPEQMAMVQQRFLRMRDNQLYEIAAFELEDLLLGLDMSHEAYPQLYQLLTWILLETEEYTRAYNFARYYENETSYTIYSLMSLGHQFKSAGQYELAAEAYRFYTEYATGINRFRSMEELASTYRLWSRHLQQSNTAPAAKIDDLYQKAYQTASELINEAPNYDRADRIYALLTDLALDHFKDRTLAQKWFDEIKRNLSQDDDYAYYAEGRIALFDKNFINTRQALTRADRNTDSSDLSERARYYLGLSDFFAGDFEFAEIQLQSLERRQTSYYANDAVKLRFWIKNGKRADSTGTLLKAIGESLHAVHTGSYDRAFPLLEPILANAGNPLTDNLITELAAQLPGEYDLLIYRLLERQINARPYSPQLERMMWDRAVLAEQYMNVSNPDFFSDPQLFESLLKMDEQTSQNALTDLDSDYVTGLFEELILRFPNGFYATYARQKLQSFETKPL